MHYTAMKDTVIAKGSTHIYMVATEQNLRSGKNGEMYELCVWYFHMMDYLG